MPTPFLKCKFSAILIRQCCHSNRRNILSIDGTWCPERSIHNFSFILLRNIHGHFLRLKLVFFSTFQETVGSHLNMVFQLLLYLRCLSGDTTQGTRLSTRLITLYQLRRLFPRENRAWHVGGSSWTFKISHFRFHCCHVGLYFAI